MIGVVILREDNCKKNQNAIFGNAESESENQKQKKRCERKSGSYVLPLALLPIAEKSPGPLLDIFLSLCA